MAYVAPSTVTAGTSPITAAAHNIIVNDIINLRALANVQSVHNSTPQTLTASSTLYTFYTFPSLSVSITPTFNTSKILIMSNFFVSVGSARNAIIRFMRDSTAIGVGTGSVGSRSPASAEFTQQIADTNSGMSGHFSFLDSPATTSAITYTLQVADNGGGTPIYGNRTINDTDAGYTVRGATSIIVKEIPV